MRVRHFIQAASARARSRGFTVIELATVLFIVAILLAFLLPSIWRARSQAREAQTRTLMKGIGDGLDLFRTDNPGEVRADGYPSSAARDDPTEPGKAEVYGAQWLVRYLLGKDNRGYVPRRVVPPELLSVAQPGWEQRDWYASGPTPYNKFAPLARVGPYISPESVRAVDPTTLAGYPGMALPGMDEKTIRQPVLVDAEEYPILYYSADARFAAHTNVSVASFDSSKPGIYRFRDNALFTGASKGPVKILPSWDFVSGGPHWISDFGQHTDDVPTRESLALPENRRTFPYYILNRNVYESSGGTRLVPVNKEGYLLISPGRDGLYGTPDDITNF